MPWHQISSLASQVRDDVRDMKPTDIDHQRTEGGDGHDKMAATRCVAVVPLVYPQ